MFMISNNKEPIKTNLVFLMDSNHNIINENNMLNKLKLSYVFSNQFKQGNSSTSVTNTKT